MEKVTKATRESFGEALCELAKTDEDIVVLDADLSAATKTSIFQKQYPERFINCGIAESNMIGVAAGLAAAGKSHLQHLLQCSQQVEHLNRLETLLHILT